MASASVRLVRVYRQPTSTLLIPVGFLLVVVAAICLFFSIFVIPGFSRTERISMRELLSVSVVLAERGGKRVREIAEAHKLEAREKGKTEYEGMKEVLTRGDLESHRAIVNGFLKAYPGMTVVSEEHENKPMDSHQIPDVDKHLADIVNTVFYDQQIPINNIAVWVDPLNAIQEYAEGLYKYVTTMVCVVVNGEPTIGVIHKPFIRETAWAWADNGHSSNLKKASNIEHDENHLQIIVSRSNAGPVETVAKKSLGENTKVVIAGGAGYRILEVIKGNVEAYVHFSNIKKRDICAGHAILKALDGKMTTLEGNYITYYPNDNVRNRDGLLATTDKHYDYLQKLAPEMFRYMLERRQNR